jgi:H+/Cl- antiporter ClcA
MNLSWKERLYDLVVVYSLDYYLLLIIMALLVSTIGVLLQYQIGLITSCIDSLLNQSISSIALAYLLSLSLGLMAIYLSINFPYVEGSGIPESKSVIAGTSFYKYMSFRTLIMKLVALTFVSGSGYIVGREGPLVHISCCVANNLSKLGVFSRL